MRAFIISSKADGFRGLFCCLAGNSPGFISHPSDVTYNNRLTFADLKPEKVNKVSGRCWSSYKNNQKAKPSPQSQTTPSGLGDLLVTLESVVILLATGRSPPVFGLGLVPVPRMHSGVAPSRRLGFIRPDQVMTATAARRVLCVAFEGATEW